MTRPDATLDQLRERVEAAEERMGVRPALCEHGRTERHGFHAKRGYGFYHCPGPAASGGQR